MRRIIFAIALVLCGAATAWFGREEPKSLLVGIGLAVCALVFLKRSIKRFMRRAKKEVCPNCHGKQLREGSFSPHGARPVRWVRVRCPQCGAGRQD